MAAAPAEDVTAALETVEKRTRAAIDALRGLEAIAQSNYPDNAAIPQCLRSVVDSFGQILACEASVCSVQVPRDVVESVDQGRNPDAFLAELAERNAAAGRAAACAVQPSLECPAWSPWQLLTNCTSSFGNWRVVLRLGSGAWSLARLLRPLRARQTAPGSSVPPGQMQARSPARASRAAPL